MPNYREDFEIKKEAKSLIYGCGGKTRTYDLRVMSPTSCQLLYPAIHYVNSIIQNTCICQYFF